MGATKSKCSGCDETFVSLEAFDMHRVGEYQRQVYNKNGYHTGEIRPSQRRCLLVQEMLALGMTKNERG